MGRMTGIVWVLCGMVLVPAWANAPMSGEVTAARVNIRTQPGTAPDCRIVKVAARGEQLTILAQEGEWYRIRMPSDCRVWVHGSHVDSKGTNATVTSNGVNIRDDARANATVVGTADQGTRVEVIGRHGAWLQIRATENCVAFISARYIATANGAVAQAPNGGTPGGTTARVEQVPVSRDYNAEIETLRGLLEAERNRVNQDRELTRQRIAALQEEINRLRTMIPQQQPAATFLFTGRVHGWGRTIGRPGTHKLLDEEGNVVCHMESEKIDLNRFYNDPVGVTGQMIQIQGWDQPTVIVTGIQRLDRD